MNKIMVITFSPTGNTVNAGSAIVKGLSQVVEWEVNHLNITVPANRKMKVVLDREDVLIIGFPVYAGRVPNKMAGFIEQNIVGVNTPAIGYVTYGNRSPGDGLSEIFWNLERNGFLPFAGCTIPSEHAFTSKLAKGRPDGKDIEKLTAFGRSCGKRFLSGDISIPNVPGNMPPGPYYIPMKQDGSPAKFLKATPVTDRKKCVACGICAEVCPMGSVDRNRLWKVKGICIKCQACIHYCPQDAKYFDDADFLSHVAMLEEHFVERKEIAFYPAEK